MVELLIAMALIAIVSVMIVSFSAMAHSFAGDEQGKHSFLDEAAAIRADINDFLMKHDKEGNVVERPEVYGLACAGDALFWIDGQKKLGGKVYNNIEDISFEISSSNSSLLKCTVTGATEKGQTYSQTFVFALRCATFEEV